ncbi:uncharacterized protein F4822DRAFT_443418 [Hypoxylon trugodes]|uniref:uncharacterized protein n=1 Tax=Hypoxylon trugodes TaxID=326681 RepID=UPI00219BBF6B|nr:uncharacterized protein F4822DRAFT_443418 [Hypoxylon trugodes]KAI1388435.1 hypothetical protein F4822DRAFT_443418 [Hypoxylon trugodes]
MDSHDKTAECVARLKKLSRDGFYLRYGDYLVDLEGSGENAWRVRKEANAVARELQGQPVGETPEMDVSTVEDFFLNQPWTVIGDVLCREEEEEKEKTYNALTPLSDFIRELAWRVNIYDILGIRIAISLYAGKYDFAHRPVREMARDGRFHRLASKLDDDLRALVTQKCISEKDREAVRLAIMRTARLYFREFHYDEDSYELISWTRPRGKNGTFNRQREMKDVSTQTSNDTGSRV